jgi:Zn-dependent oligopeptidase
MKHNAPLMLMLALTVHIAVHAATGTGDDERFWAGNPDPAAFERLQGNRLARADAALVELLRVEGKRTIENTLRPYDAILLELDAVGSQGDLIANVHPDPAMRSVAEKTRQKSETFNTNLLLNRQVYDALNTIDLTRANGEIRYYLEKTRRKFRLAGVEESEEVQKQIKALRGELVVLEQEFSDNIRADSRTIVVDSVSQLEGLPSDYPSDYLDRRTVHSPTVDLRDVEMITEFSLANPLVIFGNRSESGRYPNHRVRLLRP